MKPPPAKVSGGGLGGRRVVHRGHPHELPCASVEVVVVQVGLEALHRRGRDDLQVRVPLADRPGHLREPAVVAARAVEPVLVADLDVVQRERLGEPVGRPLLAPLAVGRAADVLDLLERLLCVKRHLRAAGLEVVAVQHVAGEEAQHRLGAELLAPEQVFRQAEPVGRPVAPAAHVPRPLVGRADHLLPVEPVGEPAALEVVAAGEADELRPQLGHQLHQVRPQAVRRVLIRRREQRDEAERDAARARSPTGRTAPWTWSARRARS